jgi:hypothetical protein
MFIRFRCAAPSLSQSDIVAASSRHMKIVFLNGRAVSVEQADAAIAFIPIIDLD